MVQGPSGPRILNGWSHDNHDMNCQQTGFATETNSLMLNAEVFECVFCSTNSD